MNKQAMIVVTLLCISGYSYAEDVTTKDKTVQVTVTSEIRVGKDMVEAIVTEAKEDAKALKEKYEPICGIDTVQTTVKRSGDTQEQITKSCGCSSCNCKTCSSGKCCKCKAVLIEDEYCNCKIVQEKCADCGEMNSEFRCNCGKPKSKDIEVSRCNCGKPKTNEE